MPTKRRANAPKVGAWESASNSVSSGPVPSRRPGTSPSTCDPLALLAALFSDRMLALVMGEIERMANDPLPSSGSSCSQLRTHGRSLDLLSAGRFATQLDPMHAAT